MYYKEFFYLCEDGNDNWIAEFKNFEEAKTFAEQNSCVKEIFKYATDGEDIECLECCWTRES